MVVPRRFNGISRLYGIEGYRYLSLAHVCVIGLGGVGSWAAEALARSGVGHLTLIDLDHVAESNTNRQLTALTSTFGCAKVKVLAERLRDINPEIKVNLIEDFVDENNFSALLTPRFNFVIEAIDQLKIKALICNFLVHRQQPFVISGAAGGKTSATQIDILDLSEVTYDRLLARLRYCLRKDFAFATKGKMKIRSVFTKEAAQLPNCITANPLQAGLSCAGYGASMVVTATFAMYLVEEAINHIVNSQC